MRRLDLLAADGGDRIAAADIQMRARLPVMFAGGLLVAERLSRHGRQIGAGFLEVVIGVGIGAGPHRAARYPFGDVFDVAPRALALEVVRHRLVARRRLQIAHRIDEDQRVFAVAVLEEIHDAFVLEQALHEIQVGFVILHAIVARRIGALQPLLEFGRAVFGENLLDDLDDAHVLEDAAVGGIAEEPQPWPDNRLVVRQPILDPGQAELRDEATEPAFRIAGFALDDTAPPSIFKRVDVRIVTRQIRR